jgi:hypothetical protein
LDRPLINGRPTSFFTINGIKVRIPHVPSIIYYNGRIIKKKLEHEKIIGRIRGLNFTRVVKGINHYQFVDDTLLLGEALTITTRISKASAR